jgi:hypothetical protein
MIISWRIEIEKASCGLGGRKLSYPTSRDLASFISTALFNWYMIFSIQRLRRPFHPLLYLRLESALSPPNVAMSLRPVTEPWSVA